MKIVQALVVLLQLALKVMMKTIPLRCVNVELMLVDQR
jgi:hypothetical protein